ncbi:hypothetical protein CEXT_531461 [Caerostris extrusa]|uniref:Uncharacterized protein n=1 Tax=Caerostris extrusa TaxID=172846 RepID=A0AAV4W9N6_CAEEX|nr:hypothetical protein CEXT_531461 [Caerostris extrusa]
MARARIDGIHGGFSGVEKTDQGKREAQDGFSRKAIDYCQGNPALGTRPTTVMADLLLLQFEDNGSYLLFPLKRSSEFVGRTSIILDSIQKQIPCPEFKKCEHGNW